MMPEQVQGEQTDQVRFFVHGQPVQQGSKTAYVVGRRAVVADSNRAKLKPWRAAVAIAADLGRHFSCPVEVGIVFHMPKPKKPKWSVPAVRPDLDKLTRALLDGLTDSGLIQDDSLVTVLSAQKVYALPLGAWVTVREADR